MEQTSAVELTRRELIPLFCKLSALGCVFTDSVGLGEKKKNIYIYKMMIDRKHSQTTYSVGDASKIILSLECQAASKGKGGYLVQ